MGEDSTLEILSGEFTVKILWMSIHRDNIMSENSP